MESRKLTEQEAMELEVQLLIAKAEGRLLDAGSVKNYNYVTGTWDYTPGTGEPLPLED